MTVSGGTEGGFIFLGSVRRAQSQANRLFDAWPVSPSSRASRPSTSARCAESGCQIDVSKASATKEAQHIIATDWFRYYRDHVLKEGMDPEDNYDVAVLARALTLPA